MSKFSTFQLPLKSLTPGRHEFEYRLDKSFFEAMESSDVRDADVNARLTVTYANDVYQLAFVLTGTLTVVCDRCLDLLDLPVDATYNVTVKYGDAYRDDSDEVLEIPTSANELNVAYMLYDTAELAIPIKHVHPLGKCNRQMSAALHKHRVTQAGDEDADLENQLIDEMEAADGDAPANTDPRWDALRDLRDDE